MKSTKKRFKSILAEIKQTASDLMLLSADISMFEAMRTVADDALRACEALNLRLTQLSKKDFAWQIIEDEALHFLDEIVDRDAISIVEERISMAWTDADNPQIAELLQQLLQQLEKHYAIMNQRIQQLGALLGDLR